MEKKGGRERRAATARIGGGETGGFISFLVLGGAMAVIALATRAMKAARARTADKDEEIDGGFESNEVEKISPPPPPPPPPQLPVSTAAVQAPLLLAPEQRLALPPPQHQDLQLREEEGVDRTPPRPPPQLLVSTPAVQDPLLVRGPEQRLVLPPPPRHQDLQQREEEKEEVNSTPPTIEVEADQVGSSVQEEEHQENYSHIDVEPSHGYDFPPAQPITLEEPQDNDGEGEQEEEAHLVEDESEVNTESSMDNMSSNESNTDPWPAEASDSSTTSLEEYEMKLHHDPKVYLHDVAMKTVKENGETKVGWTTKTMARDRGILDVKGSKGLVGFVSTIMAIVLLMVLIHTQRERIGNNLQRLCQLVFRGDGFQQKT